MMSPGRALAVALASRGIHITVLDLKTTGEETVRLVAEKHEKISYKSSSPSAIFRQCDVTKPSKSGPKLPYSLGILNLMQPLMCIML